MKTLKYLYLAVDLVTVFSSLLLAGWLKFGVGLFQTEQEVLTVDSLLAYGMLTLIFLFIFRFLCLYRLPVIQGRLNHGGRIIAGILIGHLLIIVLFFIIKYRFVTERIFVLISLAVMMTLLLLLRLVVLPTLIKFVRGRGFLGRATLLIGSGERAESLLRAINSFTNSYFKIKAILLDKPGGELNGVDDGIPRHRDMSTLPDILERYGLKEVLIAIEDEDPAELVWLIRQCQSTGLPVNVYSDTFDIIHRKMVLDQPDNLPLTRFTRAGLWNSSPLKALLDRVLSAVLLILLSPLFLILAVLIKLSSPGPVFYTGTRVGHEGKRFRIYKFRSMYIDQPNDLHKEYTRKFINGRIGAGSIYKLKNDPRVTPLGRFLRKYSLDELPQLINVLRGEMSLVGPRPSTEYEFDEYEDWHKQRFLTKPGLTGTWQAIARSEVPFRDMIALDLYYAFSAYFWMDIELLLLTVKAIFVGRGAV